MRGNTIEQDGGTAHRDSDIQIEEPRNQGLSWNVLDFDLETQMKLFEPRRVTGDLSLKKMPLGTGWIVAHRWRQGVPRYCPFPGPQNLDKM